MLHHISLEMDMVGSTNPLHFYDQILIGQKIHWRQKGCGFPSNAPVFSNVS